MNLRNKIIENLWDVEAVTDICPIRIPVLADPSGDVPVCVVKIAGIECAVHVLSVNSDNNLAGGTKLLFRGYDSSITGDNDIIVTEKETFENGAGSLMITVRSSPIVDEYYTKMGYVSMIHIKIFDNRCNLCYDLSNPIVKILLKVLSEDKEQCDKFIEAEWMNNHFLGLNRVERENLKAAYHETDTHKELMELKSAIREKVQRMTPREIRNVDWDSLMP